MGARSSRPLSISLSVLAIASYQEMISGAGARGTSGRRCRDEAQVTHDKVRSIGRIRYRRRRSCLLTVVVRSLRRYAEPTFAGRRYWRGMAWSNGRERVLVGTCPRFWPIGEGTPLDGVYFAELPGQPKLAGWRAQCRGIKEVRVDAGALSTATGGSAARQMRYVRALQIVAQECSLRHLQICKTAARAARSPWDVFPRGRSIRRLRARIVPRPLSGHGGVGAVCSIRVVLCISRACPCVFRDLAESAS